MNVFGIQKLLNKNNRKTGRRVSLKNLIPGLFLGIMIPLAMILVIYSSYIARSVEVSSSQSSRSQLEIFKSHLESAMKATERVMSGMVSGNAQFQSFSVELMLNEMYNRSYNIQEILKSNLTANQNLYTMAVYSPVNNWYSGEYNAYYEITSSQRIKAQKNLEAEVKRLINQGDFDLSKWFFRSIGGREYLLRGMNYRTVYCIAVIDLERLNNIAVLNYRMNGTLIFGDGEKMIYQDLDLGLSPDEFVKAGDSYMITGSSMKYLIVSDQAGYITMVYARPYNGILNELNLFHIIVIICAVMAVLSVPFVSIWLWELVVNPISHLTKTIEAIRNGDLSAHVDTYAVEEFCQVNDMFNQMIDEISELKIASYEKELEKQNTEYQLLQSQIRPHFYLNCLKNIYGMAESGKNREIQQTILHLSSYLRYIFTITKDCVPLQKELEVCQNYTDLFSLNQYQSIEFSITYDAMLTNIPIPPVSLLTFIENSIHHGFVTGQKLKLMLKVSRIVTDERVLIHITVADNGRGFEQSVISSINKEEIMIDEKGKKHVGIYNVLKRFRLRYGDDFAAAFRNREGALVELFFPYTGGEDL
ncbi:histidine kinase [Lacrimispora sp.]|uniref:sensor histidine kinase n=2 Tax=Lacrimispora TaxID=2719231 RepID=UPI0029DEAD6E|nr:two-component system, sensor histidine kinase YesM [Lacrimispora sp.]